MVLQNPIGQPSQFGIPAVTIWRRNSDVDGMTQPASRSSVAVAVASLSVVGRSIGGGHSLVSFCYCIRPSANKAKDSSSASFSIQQTALSTFSVANSRLQSAYGALSSSYASVQSRLTDSPHTVVLPGPSLASPTTTVTQTVTVSPTPAPTVSGTFNCDQLKKQTPAVRNCGFVQLHSTNPIDLDTKAVDWGVGQGHDSLFFDGDYLTI